MANIDNDKRVTELLKSLDTNRIEMYEQLKRIKEVRGDLSELLPKDKNYLKNKFLLEQRIKTLTEICKIELDVTKSIEGSIKSEIELIRRLERQDDTKEYDITEIVKTLDKIESSKEKNKEKIAEAIS